MSSSTAPMTWPIEFGLLGHQDVSLIDDEVLQLTTHVYDTPWDSPHEDHLIITTYREDIPTPMVSTGIRSCCDITTPTGHHGLNVAEDDQTLKILSPEGAVAAATLEQLYLVLEDEYECGGMRACNAFVRETCQP